MKSSVQRRRAHTWDLPEIGPHPDGGSLTARIDCRTSDEDRDWPTHDVVIHPDWTVEVPHDLEAERVAAAFGSPHNCLHLADGLGPVLRVSVQYWGRRWVPRPRPGSRRERVTRETVEERLHESRVYHLHDVQDRHHVHDEDLYRVAEARRGRRYDDWRAPHHPDHLIREQDGAQRLWDVGVHPDVVTAIATEIPTSDPLPISTYLGVYVRDTDLDWIRDTVGDRDDPDLVDWLVWSQDGKDLVNPTARSRWLALGLGPEDIDVLRGAGYTIAELKAMAKTHDWSPQRCARMLRAWSAVGCNPAPSSTRCCTTSASTTGTSRPRQRSEVSSPTPASSTSRPGLDELGVMLRDRRVHARDPACAR